MRQGQDLQGLSCGSCTSRHLQTRLFCLLSVFTKSATGRQPPECVPASQVVVPEELRIPESGAQVSL